MSDTITLLVWSSVPLKSGTDIVCLHTVIFGFFFVTVSARITGEIGSSSNPISGMTVATLLLTCLIFLLVGWTGLTDGVIDSDVAPGCFATDNSDHFPKEVTIDLGMLYPINRIAVHNAANGNTRKVSISVSSDGRQYTSVREFIFPAGEYMALVHSWAAR